MSHTWKLLPLAVFAAVGAFMLLAGNSVSPRPDAALADVTACGSSGDTLRIDIIDSETGDRIAVAGSEVTIDPDPQDGTNTRTFVDNGTNDDSTTIGRIQQNDACNVTTATPAPTEYTATLDELPAALDDCDIVDNSISFNFTGSDTIEFEVDNCPDVTPTATATGTVSAVRTVAVTSANQSLGCANTTIITISVRTSAGAAVPAGTQVNVQASIGAVSPTSGQTTADGSVFVFYTAPQNQGGTATITATSGSSSGTANIVINCNVAPTQAPPPTTSPAVIQPPNTGDGGLSGSSSWRTYAGIAMILASVIGTLVVVRPRA